MGDVVTSKPWQSKTMWLNALAGIILAVSMFYPPASALSKFIADNASAIGLVWSMANLILRAVTKNAISLVD